MKLSLFGRFGLALFASMILGLGMTGCGGGTIGFLWTVGQQYNQIAGFKIDDYTGNLTQIPHQPFTSGGTNPINIVIKPGGRYAYVLNQGTLPSTCTSAATCTTTWTGGNISVFSVGGDGVLTLQSSYTSQGYDSQWIQMDASGSYLYVLDQYGPVNPTTNVRDGNGSITVFAVDSATGRLTLVTNTNACVSSNGGTVCPTFFEVGSATSAFAQPFQMKTAGSCLFVANRTGVVPFSISGAQLSNTTTGPTITGVQHISSITGTASFINLTDDTGNQVFRYTVGSSCGLSVTGGGAVNMAQYQVYNPSWTLFDSSGKYLYVYGYQTPNTTQANSRVEAFNITTSTQTQPISSFGTGSGPVCAVEDPTNQYIYTSNFNDGTITGNIIDTTTGNLSSLTRGSTFSATGQLKCLAVSGAVD